MTKVFEQDKAQAIVDTIQIGYNAYLNLRLQKAKEMAVSGGFAWTKSNHIEDAFVKANLPFVLKHTKQHAGHSWEYLEFHTDTELGKTLVMLKAELRLQQVFGRKATARSSYLYDKAKINEKWLREQQNFKQPLHGTQKIQLELFETLKEFPDELLTEFDHFMIITYATDFEDKRLISSVKVYLPDPIHNVLHLQQDLSEFIALSAILPIADNDRLKDLEDDVPVEDFDIRPREIAQTL